MAGIPQKQLFGWEEIEALGDGKTPPQYHMRFCRGVPGRTPQLHLRRCSFPQWAAATTVTYRTGSR